MAKIFVYRDYLGCDAVKDNSNGKVALSDAVINDPFGKGQLGVVCDASKCQFSEEAINFLSKLQKSTDSLGTIDCFGEKDKQVSFGWLGGVKAIFTLEADTARDTDFSLLTPTEGVEIPDDFKQHVDAMIQGREQAEKSAK